MSYHAVHFTPPRILFCYEFKAAVLNHDSISISYSSQDLWVLYIQCGTESAPTPINTWILELLR
jgi:hypothetical protein